MREIKNVLEAKMHGATLVVCTQAKDKIKCAQRQEEDIKETAHKLDLENRLWHEKKSLQNLTQEFDEDKNSLRNLTHRKSTWNEEEKQPSKSNTPKIQGV